MMDSVKTGRYIAEQRKLLRITQRELADMLGVTNRTVSKWETGTGMPDIGVLPILAEILGTTVDCILSGEDASSEMSPKIDIDVDSIVDEAEISEDEKAEIKKEIEQKIEHKEKKLAKYILDKQIMQFRMEAMVCVAGGIVSIIAFFVMSQLATYMPMVFAFLGGLLLDGIAFVTFMVFFFNMQREINAYNETFSDNVSFRKIWSTFAKVGIWVWTAVPTLFTVYMILTLTFGLNRIVYGIIWIILYISICIPIAEEKFHK